MNRSRPALYGLLGSLLAHAAIAWLWLSGRAEAPRPPPQRWLTVTTVGIVTGRQVEARRPEPQAPRPAPAPRRMPHVRAPAPVPVAPAAAVAAEPEPMPPAPPAASSPSGEARVAGNAQAAQTVAPRSVDVDRLRRYVAELTRAIQTQLVYPPEARDTASIGTPTIGFTIADDGSIVPGTLRLVRSSGTAVLDEAALRAARAAAPFPRPPERMDIAVTVAFAPRD